MQLTILGSSGTFPRPMGACNGYLVTEGDSRVLIDMGTGVLARLYRHADPGSLDAIVITHLHADHFLDIYPYRYYLEFTAEPAAIPKPVYAPPGARERILCLFTEPTTEKFDRVFDFREMSEGATFAVSGLSFTPLEVPHMKPTFGLRIQAGGKTIFYTSDTDYDPGLIEMAAGADILLAETTLTADYAEEKVAHMTTTEVGRLAKAAEVGLLIPNHLWPQFDRARILAEVAAEFDGRIELADEDRVYQL